MKFDLQQIEGLGSIMATDEEIAAVLGCSLSTIDKRKQSDPEFLRALEKGKATGRLSLRRQQWSAARGQPASGAQSAIPGNPTMMIWLGKQWLDQRDKRDVVTREDHQEFQESYLRAGSELIRAVRRGDDLDQAMKRFVVGVRGDDTNERDKTPSDIN